MLGFPLGILSAAGAGVEGDFELIESEILTTAAATITFSSLATYASTYKHLQLRIAARSSGTSITGAGVLLRINNDTGTNYARHVLQGDGSTVASAGFVSQTSMQIGNIFSNLDPANAFGASVADFLDVYSTTKNKTVKSLAGTNLILFRSGVRLNTEAVSTITLTLAGDNFLAGSRFSLYGIRG